MTGEILAEAHRDAALLAERVRLPMRSRAWKGQAGEFAGSGSGASLDFQDHRSYQAGDDPRHINWQAYARTGQHTMKLFREEVRPIVELVVDVSRSMIYDARKARVTAALAFLTIQSAAAMGAAIRVHTLCGGNATTLDTQTLEGVQWFADACCNVAADSSVPPDPARVELRANTVRVFLSDLLYSGDPERMLQQLGGRGSMLVMLVPYLDEEASPGWEGNCELIDVERATRHPGKIDAKMMARYRSGYANHFDLWSTVARRHHAALGRIPADVDFSIAILRHALPAGAMQLA